MATTQEPQHCPIEGCTDEREFKNLARHTTSAHGVHPDGTKYTSPHEKAMAATANHRKKKPTHQRQRIKMRHPKITDTDLMDGFMTIIGNKKVPMTQANLRIMAKFADQNKELLTKLHL
jgi:hypothetical protein